MAQLDRRIAAWFADNRRDLPWRRTDPWGVLVSEFMLQQTPVVRVLEPWRTWMQRWPTPTDLADAPAADAIRAWGRLGYPRRAVRLHQTASAIRDLHDGEVPRNQTELLALPGVGEYTAAAVRAFAYAEPSVVVDINVRRFLARVITARDPAPSATAAERLLAHKTVADLDVPAHTWAAAAMEYGALVCTARNPACAQCVVADLCDWLPSGGQPTRRQPRYEGSLRQARGTVLAALREGPAQMTDFVTPQMSVAVQTLVDDGLAAIDGQWLSLP